MSDRNEPVLDVGQAAGPANGRAATRIGETTKLTMKRTVRSGLMGGKKFEVWARVEADYDISAFFKGYPDELVLAYKSMFADRSVSLKRSDLIRGTRLSCASLNEMIEFEDRLELGFEQLKRMVEIVRNAETERILT
jgi:hypothetical protein